MNRKFINISILILSCILLLSNCSRRAKVGVLFDISDKGRWIKDRELIESNIEQLGGETIYKASFGDAEKQYLLAQELIDEGIHILIVVASNMNTAANIVTLAHKNNVQVIGYDRMIKNSELDFYISFDNVQVGELQAAYIVNRCPTGKYAIVGGAMTDNNSFLIRLGQLNILQPLIEKGDIQIIFDQYANVWKQEEGYRLMTDCLDQNQEIDAVMVAADELANGVWQAIEEINPNHIPCMCGQDATVEACKRILKGKQTMTVYKPIKNLAKKASEIAMQMYQNKEIPTTTTYINNGKRRVPSILLSSMSINAENLREILIADDYLTEEQLRLEVDSIP